MNEKEKKVDKVIKNKKSLLNDKCVTSFMYELRILFYEIHNNIMFGFVIIEKLNL